MQALFDFCLVICLYLLYRAISNLSASLELIIWQMERIGLLDYSPDRPETFVEGLKRATEQKAIRRENTQK